MSEKSKIAVLGGGSFGTVIADNMAENGHDVVIWMRNESVAQSINDDHENPEYLPGIKLNSRLHAETDLEKAVKDRDMVFVSIPSKSFRDVVTKLDGLIREDTALISTTKGIEPAGFKLMSQIISEVYPNNPLAVISGPNLAKEIAQKQPAATVVACQDSDLRSRIQKAVSNRHFRAYASNDIYGVELGGALKNIYAIVSGLAASVGFGENTRSMLITRSLAEMSRFATALGANPLTFLGLAGVGDLVATCMSPLSRNYRVGYALGKGEDLETVVDELGEVAEGVNTLKYVKQKAEEMDIYMPLVTALYAVIYKGLHVDQVTKYLMTGELSTDVEFSLPKNELGG